MQNNCTLGGLACWRVESARGRFESLVTHDSITPSESGFFTGKYSKSLSADMNCSAEEVRGSSSVKRQGMGFCMSAGLIFRSTTQLNSRGSTNNNHSNHTDILSSVRRLLWRGSLCHKYLSTIWTLHDL